MSIALDQIIAACHANTTPVSKDWRTRAHAHLDTLTKPLGSLGRLEDIAAQIVAIRGDRSSEPLSKAAFIFAADHGVTAEGVSAYPSEVTRQMVLNFVAGGAAINVLARLHHVDLAVVDVGVASSFAPTDNLLHRKIAHGSDNLRRRAALTHEQMLQALQTGAEMATSAQASGHNLIAAGEMGIGNTTAASAITCALLDVAAEIATGRGTGVSAETYAHKVDVVQASVALHFGESREPTPLEILRCVGGLEIAAMTGFFLRAAQHGMVIVLDGFIATAAATLAVAIVPATRGYMIAGHRSEEPGHALLLNHMHLKPLLTLDMRLGEGTGAVLAMPLLESAMAIYREMATFASAGVSEATT